jgi:CheY-like chemotaxis protein
MEGIGQVAAGVAHHFNNILTIISGQVSLLQEKSQDPVSAGRLEQVSTAVTRAAALNQQLLAAGGRQRLHPEAVDLNGLIQKFKPMLAPLMGEQIAVMTDYDAHLTLVQADRHLIEQAIMQLALNARDAMAGGGTLTISTKAVRISEEQSDLQQIKPGDYVRLTLRDTGCGIQPEAQSHLFEPFFTTRDIGKALGLGLASVHGAVKQMSGRIEFESEVGVGTEFRVFLPCAGDATTHSSTSEGTAKPAALGTVLLVLADDRTRDMARCVLNWHNYGVIEADSSSMATLLWQGQASKVDLLLTDLNFPDGSTGSLLFEQLRQSRPNLKVAYVFDPDAGERTASSPDNAEVQARKDACSGQAGVIYKPLRPPALLQAVQAQLA